MRPCLPDHAWQWLNDIFAAKAAQRGGTVRRAVRDVEAAVGREVFIAEIRRRGFGLIENGGQFIVICNREPIRRLA
jgi:hypothetical protein